MLRPDGPLSMHLVLQRLFSKSFYIGSHNPWVLTLCFRHNKQHTKVYNQDCNLLLEHAIQVHDGKNPPPLRSLDDGEPLPPLPKPGRVDLICGGM